jgi:hypothetical protein
LPNASDGNRPANPRLGQLTPELARKNLTTTMEKLLELLL